MKQDQIIHNFAILSSRRVDELDAVLHLMSHEKSGAWMVWLEHSVL